jgi:acetyltransferase-like isoleucine patch superfamily enzyme
MRKILFSMATLFVLPLLCWQWTAGRLFGADATLEGTSSLLAMIPGRFGVLLRGAFYHYTLEHCDPSVWICFGTLLSKTQTRLGSHVYIGPYCVLGLVSIQRDTLLGPGVQIPSGQKIHLFDDLAKPIREQGGVIQRVSIGADCWIGSGSIVMADVADQVIVGAGSVVTKPLPKRVVAAGVPARVVREREEGLEVQT